MADINGFPKRRRVVLMRHGEVNYFEDGRPVPPPEARLNAEGREHARLAGMVLANMAFERVITSGLSRTIETAQIVMAGRSANIEQIPALQEIRGGRVMDLPPAQRRDVFLNSMTHHLNADSQFLMGEHFGAFSERVVAAFQALMAEQDWQQILIVAHGAVNRAILAAVLHAPIEAMGHIEQDAGCINMIDIDPHGYGIIRLLNYTAYNQNKQGLDLTTMERYFLDFPQDA